MERQLIHDFIRRKGWRMMWEKNKEITHTLAFPFSLNQLYNKVAFQKKQICALENMEERRHAKMGFQDVSQVL